jgi:hypothetical protein
MLTVIPSGPTVTDLWQTVFAGGTFFVAVIASALGLWQFRDFRANVREQTRPYVTVELGTRGVYLYIEIKNVGTRPASNIAVKLSPEIQSSTTDFEESARRQLDPTEPLTVLAPGQSKQIVFDGVNRAVGRPDLPQHYQVEISYEDRVPRKICERDGFWWKRVDERYVDAGHSLSLKLYDGALVPPLGIEAIAKAAQEIAGKMPDRKFP